MTAEENFKDICDLTTKVLGLPKEHLLVKNRKDKYMIPRAIACIIGRLENGTKHNTISKILGFNRATIYYYEKQHHKRFKFWAEYRKTFNKVYVAYKNSESDKKTFIRSASIYNHLINNGIQESDRPDLSILIKSGNVSTEIKSCYFECSAQLKKIKFAMKEYKYELKLIDLNESI